MKISAKIPATRCARHVHPMATAAVLAFTALAFTITPAAAQTSAPVERTPVASASAMSPVAAAQRFRQGQVLERRRNLRGAFDAYFEAGEAGNGPAQKKLGDLYISGGPVVARDYETALRWYHKAREQGVDIPKPFSYSGAPVVSQ